MFFRSLFDNGLDCFFLAIMNEAVVNSFVCLFVDRCSFLLGSYQEVKFLGLWIVHLTLWETAQQFFRVVPFYTHQHWMRVPFAPCPKAQCHESFTSAILVGVKRLLVVVSIWIILMTNYVEHLSIYLISAFVKYPSLSLTFFLLQFVLSLLSCKSLYILIEDLLSGIGVVNIFSWSVIVFPLS